MSDPGLALQKAVVAALKNDAGVTALVAGRVYDTVPAGATFPYLSLGADQLIPDRAYGYEGTDITFTVDVWSRKPGYPEAKAIRGAVRDALNGAELTIDEFRLIDLTVDAMPALRDPDGLTTHIPLSVTAKTEPIN